MFIRYNNTGKYYEYDTSAAQNGSGPWSILLIDGSSVTGIIPNAAYVNRSNSFVTPQNIFGAGGAELQLNDTNAITFRLMSYGSKFQVWTGNSALLTLDGGGNVLTAGNINSNGSVTATAQLYLLDNTANGIAFVRVAANSLGILNGAATNWCKLIIGDLLSVGVLTERNRPNPVGEWISVAYNAADYIGAGGMTITLSGSATSNYTLIGKTLIWNYVAGPFTIGGTISNALSIKIPGGFSSSGSMQQMGQINFGSWMPAIVTVNNSNYMNIYRIDVGNYVAGNMYLAFQAIVPIQ